MFAQTASFGMNRSGELSARPCASGRLRAASPSGPDGVAAQVAEGAVAATREGRAAAEARWAPTAGAAHPH
eukprot:7446079-Pyramimonas_sp.AAC.1